MQTRESARAGLAALFLVAVLAVPASAAEDQAVAAFASATSGNAPLTIEFNAEYVGAQSGSAFDYQWDFGDGTGGSGSDPVHVFREAGSYPVRLFATPLDGEPQIAELSISVREECCEAAAPLAITANSLVIIDNGMVNIIDDATFASSFVRVRNSDDGSVTTLNVLPGAEIATQVPSSGVGLEAFDQSEVNIVGGSVGNLIAARDDSTITLSGGNHPGRINGQQNGVFVVRGGTIAFRIPSFFTGSSTLDFSGGALSGSLALVSTSTDPLAKGVSGSISGGSIDFLNVGGGGIFPEPVTSFVMSGGLIGPRFNNAIQMGGSSIGRISGGIIKGDVVLGVTSRGTQTLSISGGILEGGLAFGGSATRETIVRWSGGSIAGPPRQRSEELFLFSGQLRIIGSDFNFPFGPIDAFTGTINGFLADGSPINNTFRRIRLEAAIILVLAVAIDIKPGSEPNCLNINGHGVIPVAILGSYHLDVLEIDASSLSFGGLGVRAQGKKGPLCGVEFSNEDEYWDLVCQFEGAPNIWSADEGVATLTGMLLDGTPIEGSDSICIVP